jgi:hypothetical protein
MQTNPLDNLPMDWEVLKQIEGADERAQQGWASLEKRIEEVPPVSTINTSKPHAWSLFPYKRITAVTAVILLFVFVGYLSYSFLRQRNQSTVSSRKSEAGNFDLPAGGIKAILMLSDNSPRSLNDKRQGEIARDGGVAIVNSEKGWITYKPVAGDERDVGLNTLMVPRTGMYQVELSDKTIMYVNAESTVKYPTKFNDSIREVFLERGEAYFKVAHDIKKPFIVRFKDNSIRVLGTEFNINTYADNGEIKATLITGSILMKADGDFKLSENQQAVISNGNKKVQILKNVDTQGDISWKDGFFSFHKVDLFSIMKQAERWYNVKVKFVNDSRWISDSITTGKFSRDCSLIEFLETVSYKRFKYTLKEKEVTIE